MIVPPSNEIDILLVGCGTVSRLFYAAAIAELQRKRSIGNISVCDSNLRSAQSLAKNLNARTHEHLTHGLATRPTLVIIATPPAIHKVQVEESLNAGCHVLCEKPLASNALDAMSMKDVAKQTKKILAVGHYKRFFPAAQQIKTIIDEKSFGKLDSIVMHEGGKFSWPVESDSFFKKYKTPGGVLFDLGIHALDLLVWWLGRPTIEHYWDDAAGGLEANAKVLLNWGDLGCKAKLFFSRDWQTSMRWRFEFERAYVDWKVNDAKNLVIRFKTDQPYELSSELMATDGYSVDSHAQSFTRHLKHVLESITEASPLRTSVADSIEVLELIERCYSSRSHSGQC